jgi:hypothetical protein
MGPILAKVCVGLIYSDVGYVRSLHIQAYLSMLTYVGTELNLLH